MQPVIDLNSDLGEGYGRYQIVDDTQFLPLVSSVNIACGFHAGDPRTMADMVRQSVAHHVGIGAHPGFPDLVGFGRRDMALSQFEITTDFLYQIGALSAFVKAYGGVLQHVSPHGRLGNLVVTNRHHAEAVVDAIVAYDSNLIVVAQRGVLADLARQRGLRVAIQIFGDRAYDDDGMLVSRTLEHAVIHDQNLVVERCVRMVTEGKVSSITGKDIEMNGHTLTLHGDTTGSLELARKVRAALLESGVAIRKLGDFL